MELLGRTAEELAPGNRMEAHTTMELLRRTAEELAPGKRMEAHKTMELLRRTAEKLAPGKRMEAQKTMELLLKSWRQVKDRDHGIVRVYSTMTTRTRAEILEASH